LGSLEASQARVTLFVPARARLDKRRQKEKRIDFRNGGFITVRLEIMEIISRCYALAGGF
jgi:ferredoxin-NADP reductase